MPFALQMSPSAAISSRQLAGSCKLMRKLETARREMIGCERFHEAANFCQFCL